MDAHSQSLTMTEQNVVLGNLTPIYRYTSIKMCRCRSKNAVYARKSRQEIRAIRTLSGEFISVGKYRLEFQ